MRVCKICTHPFLGKIDKMLSEGVPTREIAERWSVSRDSVVRHGKNHLDRPVPATVGVVEPQRGILASSEMSFIDRIYFQQDVLHNLQGSLATVRDHVAVQKALLGLYSLEAQIRGLMVKPRENEDRLRSAVEAIRLYCGKHPQDDVTEVIEYVARSRRLDAEMLKAAYQSE